MGKSGLGTMAGAVVLGAGSRWADKRLRPRTVSESDDPAPPIRRRVR